jgi:biopolymer transport protein TolR
MAVSLGQGAQAGHRRRRRAAGRGPIADINMTPFIDVMLVLLIIFMIAAPLLASGVPVDLPQTGAGPLKIDKRPVTLSIDERGDLFLNDRPVPMTDLVARIREAATEGAEERIYVRGHRRVDYGRVAAVMATITGAGFRRVALVTESDETPR